MTGYFISRKVASDNKEAADFSSVSDKAYRLFSKGYVQRIEVCSPPNQKEKFFVRCKVHPQMKDGTYDVELVVSRKEDVISKVEWAKCACPAGKGPHASCKHLSALFYALEEFCQVGFSSNNRSIT